MWKAFAISHSLVDRSSQRTSFELRRPAIVAIVLRLVMLWSFQTVHVHQLDLHLRSVHYPRWMQQNSLAHPALDSANSRIRLDARPVVVMPVQIMAEPKPGNADRMDSSVPLHRLLLRFKLSLRSSCDSDPLLL
jgi:hypothetical protein